MSFLVPAVPGSCHCRLRLLNSFPLPELQCFISDSQLTRDAALHPRLGDKQVLLLTDSTLGRREVLVGSHMHHSSSCTPTTTHTGFPGASLGLNPVGPSLPLL